MLALLLAAAIAPGTFAVDPAASSLRYVVTHKLHEVDAASKEVEGKAVVKADFAVLAEFRAAVASFKSGDGNRDEHMLETMQAASIPLVSFKAVAHLGAGGKQDEPLVLKGQLEFHGVKKPYSFPVTLEPQADGSVRVKGAFDVSLDAHGVERPSLLLVPIEDACRIDVDLLLRRAP
jgi:polyisoprenoid-binding protein YceI